MGQRVMGIAKVAVMLAVCCAQNVLITQPGGARSAPVMGYGPMLIMRAKRGLGASEHASQLTVIFMFPEHASSHNSDGLKRRTRSLPRRRRRSPLKSDRCRPRVLFPDLIKHARQS